LGGFFGRAREGGIGVSFFGMLLVFRVFDVFCGVGVLCGRSVRYVSELRLEMHNVASMKKY
jgi:hypothetical protein